MSRGHRLFSLRGGFEECVWEDRALISGLERDSRSVAEDGDVGLRDSDHGGRERTTDTQVRSGPEAARRADCRHVGAAMVAASPRHPGGGNSASGANTLCQHSLANSLSICISLAEVGTLPHEEIMRPTSFMSAWVIERIPGDGGNRTVGFSPEVHSNPKMSRILTISAKRRIGLTLLAQAVAALQLHKRSRRELDNDGGREVTFAELNILSVFLHGSGYPFSDSPSFLTDLPPQPERFQGPYRLCEKKCFLDYPQSLKVEDGVQAPKHVRKEETTEIGCSVPPWPLKGPFCQESAAPPIVQPPYSDIEGRGDTHPL
ncbi:hypothetical protein AAG570_004067 [Ranatra chinensis]|uniref:Uncharacterized protein n=1 Tax=Ranatra chinensis TaxID=642074 RepID=A0ABD0Y2P6_9HEMI